MYKRIALFCFVCMMLFLAIVRAQSTEARIYELYNSTSTPENYKRLLKRSIDRQERAEKLRGKARRSVGKRGLAVPATNKTTGVLSAVPASAPAEFRLGEVYCYPNPAKRTNPTFHIETGLADKVELKLYDVSGDFVHETTLSGAPQLIDDGQGPQYAYEYQWDVRNAGSGVYIFSIVSRQGDKTLKKTGRCAVIK